MKPASIYLDCAATTPIEPRVLEVVVHYLSSDYGNAGSRTHDFGAAARRAVEKARDQVAAMVAARRGEVVFTSGATESNNLAILGLAESGRKTNRRHIVSTQIEHNAVLEPLDALAKRGFEITLVPPDCSGAVDAQTVLAAVRPDTLLVSVMQANNETGVLQPIVEIARLLADHQAYFHVDASQGFGKEVESLRLARVDLISISGHKIYAPKGVGALVARRRQNQRPPLTPLIYGGGQELGLRPGTLPVHLIAGLGLAAELALEESVPRNTFCRQFKARLLSALSPLGVVVNGDVERALPQIINLSFRGRENQEVIETLHGLVAISDGSACTSQSLTCSHVLGAMSLDADRAAGATRWSWCHLTPEPDWAAICRALT